MNRLAPLAVAALLLIGCKPALTVSVVDIDAGFRPLPGATVSRFPTPKRYGDAWSTTPAEVQQTDATGKTKFGNGFGRFVVAAPGKADASFYSAFPPSQIEIGVAAGATTK